MFAQFGPVNSGVAGLTRLPLRKVLFDLSGKYEVLRATNCAEVLMKL